MSEESYECHYCTQEFENIDMRTRHQDDIHNVAYLSQEGHVGELVRMRLEALQAQAEE